MLEAESEEPPKYSTFGPPKIANRECRVATVQDFGLTSRILHTRLQLFGQPNSTQDLLRSTNQASVNKPLARCASGTSSGRDCAELLEPSGSTQKEVCLRLYPWRIRSATALSLRIKYIQACENRISGTLAGGGGGGRCSRGNLSGCPGKAWLRFQPRISSCSVTNQKSSSFL